MNNFINQKLKIDTHTHKKKGGGGVECNHKHIFIHKIWYDNLQSLPLHAVGKAMEPGNFS